MTQLQPSRCKQAEFQRMIYSVTPEQNTPFDALLMPHYWAHVSQGFRPGCRIEVYPPEGHYYAELLVQDCGRLYAKVALLRKVDLDEVQVSGENLDTSEFSVSYCGPAAEWCVHRIADEAKGRKKDLLKSQLPDKDAAVAWMVQHARTVNRPKAA